MKSAIHVRAARWLFAAAVVFGAAAPQAAGGVAISVSQQRDVRIGMSQTEVLQILGRPALTLRYRGAPGQSWTYHVSGAPYGTLEYNVDFGADGKVIFASQRGLPSAG